MGDPIRAHVIVRGVVQGVYFRASTAKMARGLEVSGWVRNLPDGSVEAVLEGDAPRVAEAIEWLREGPPRAIVDSVTVEYEPPLGETGFGVR